MPFRVGACGVVEDEQRQRVNGLEDVQAHERAAKGGEEEGGRFAADPRDAEDHAGHYSAQARRQDYLQDSAGIGDAEAQGSLFERVGDQLQGFLGGHDDDRKHHDAEGHAA